MTTIRAGCVGFGHPQPGTGRGHPLRPSLQLRHGVAE
jgi:hypothetical protein